LIINEPISHSINLTYDHQPYIIGLFGIIWVQSVHTVTIISHYYSCYYY